MLVITIKIKKLLEKKTISIYSLSKTINYPESPLGRMINGKINFSESVTEKLLPILEISKEEFKSWVIIDKYPKEIIQKAVESIKNKSDNKIPVFTQNIDKILKEKNMSRTALAKAIKYDQPSVNNMITGKKSISKTVLTRISEFLEIPEEDLQAWILADKYSLKVLELALEIN
jgi:plasmid maintenance system antidote protein VapI